MGCWAIAAATTVQAHVALATGVELNVSEQHFIDCTYTQYNGSFNLNKSGVNSTNGCSGGTYDDVFAYIRRGGVTAAEQYPYVSKHNGGKPETCKMESVNAPTVVAGISDYASITSKNSTDFMRVLAEVGPIAVAVDASTNWDYYGVRAHGDWGGIMDNCSSRKVDHDAVLVGYGQENGTKYWLVQNGWDSDWGEGGFIRLRRYDNPEEEPCHGDQADKNHTNCGTCGVLSVGFYPLGVFLHEHIPKNKSLCALNGCGGDATPDWLTCNCDADCLQYGDCCEDYQPVCTPYSVSSEFPRGSCSHNLCVGYRPWLGCQCDSLCVQHGNCCHDYAQLCVNASNATW